MDPEQSKAPKLRNPEQYIGRFARNRRSGKVRITDHLGGRIFRFIRLKDDVYVTGGLGTTFQLLKENPNE
jgi:hypothetical protein